jgi:tRNA A37 threonylcarbamoyladenosine dehydratase
VTCFGKMVRNRHKKQFKKIAIYKNYEGKVLKPVKIGVLGLGTVGGGTVNVLKRNAE